MKGNNTLDITTPIGYFHIFCIISMNLVDKGWKAVDEADRVEGGEQILDILFVSVVFWKRYIMHGFFLS